MSNLVIIDTAASGGRIIPGIFRGLSRAGHRLTILTDDVNKYSSLSGADVREMPSGLLKPWPLNKINLNKLFKKYHMHRLVLIGRREKLSLTSAAEGLKLPVTWIEFTEETYDDLSHKRLADLALAATGASIICLSESAVARRKDLAWPDISLHCLRAPVEPIVSSVAKSALFSRCRASGIKPLLTVGTVVDMREVQRVEGLLRLVKSCLEINFPIQLVIIGDGEERVKVSWLVKKMNLDHLVWLVGEREALDKWYGFFDLLIIANKKPSIGDLGVALGALSSGIPIAAEDSPVLAEVLLPGMTGELINLDDVDSIAATLKYLYDHPERRKNMGEIGKRLAYDEYSYNRNMANWISYLN